MKKRFLPISLLLTIIILAQTSFVVNAKEDSGKYNPRSTSQATAHSFMKSIRANQETGLIDPAWLVESQSTQSRNDDFAWTSLGPDNYGSMTRSIVYDNQDPANKTIYIGTMGGGVLKSVNGGITWKTIGTNLMVSSMVQTEDGTLFVGTGDGRGAHNHNGLSDLNYENSFVGTGIYKISGTEIEKTEDATFVNDMAAFGNKVYAATSEGLKLYEGGAWSTIMEGEAYGVEVCEDGGIVAVIGNDVYMTVDGNLEVVTTGEDNMLPADESYKIVAVAPSDHNFIYVAYLKDSNKTGNIYYTDNHGAEWKTAYTASNLYDIFEDRGYLDNAMAVYPNDPRKVLVGGVNLWVIKDETGEGIFRLECISSGSGFQISQSGGTFFYNYQYIHSGIQSIAFNPSNVNEFFVGSEGGVFKGTCSAATGYLFEGANRYMESADVHTSVTRMFSVGFDGNKGTLGGCLDHGTIHILGDETINDEVNSGNAIYPNDIATTNAAETYGAFTFSKAGGPCVVSTIDPQIMFVTATGSNPVGTPLMRTQTAGYDYDKDNFSYSVTDETTAISNSDAFRTPIALFENYNDTKAVELAKFINRTTDTLPAGSTVQLRSQNSEYPFDYTLVTPLNSGDSIEVQDIISSTMLVAVKGKVYMTRDALIFNEVARWWQIGTITGIPNALSISADGDVAYVGTIEGKFYKATGLTDAVTELAALGAEAIQGVDGTDSIAAVPSVVSFEELADATAAFNGQAITSIAINPNDANDVIVTLGNYGNENYVFRSNNGGTSFSAKQGDLAAKPVYASLIEKTEGKVFVGTEDGIFVSDDMNTWTNAGVAGVPVMDIKQQLQANHDNAYVYLVDEIGEVTTITYPGVFNEGAIFVATYGRGLYRSDAYLNTNPEINVEEVTMTETVEMSVYPNPIFSEATICFNIENNAEVSYQIYDLSGRMVMNETLGNYTQGSHTATFNANRLTAGTYIIKVQAGAVSNTSKIIVY